MNLLLVSKGLSAVNSFLRSASRIGFIPTAGEPYPDPYFVEEDRTQLTKLGFEVQDIDITRLERNSILDRIRAVDALFVAGGNTFYLLQQIKSKNLHQDLREYILQGGFYVGASAGAVICGPTIEPVQTLDDPSEAPNLSDFTAVGAVDFVVLPHYGKQKYLEKYHSILKEYANTAQLVLLRDSEALIVGSRNEYEIVSSN